MEQAVFVIDPLSITSGNEPGILFTLAHRDLPPIPVRGPRFEVDGTQRDGFVFAGAAPERPLPRGGREAVWTYEAPGEPALRLAVAWRGYPGSPVLRLQYRLTAAATVRLTKSAGGDRLDYLGLDGRAVTGRALSVIQLSHFDQVAHSYLPGREDYAPDAIYDGMACAGPIALWYGAGQTLLLAYEHGADHPDSFLEFAIEGEEPSRSVTLRARKGNYHHGQAIGPNAPFTSVWFELGAAPGGIEDFLPSYRRFLLQEINEELESRRPYIFYNTWNYQERNRYFRGRPYLESMHQERMLAEIEVAHRMGIDVFVIDTGWYIKTGDWRVNTDRFPDGLREIRRRLDEYGMKLGLWFNPTVAALTSDVYRAHPEYEMTRGGRPAWRGQVWETEESTSMCLASDYAEHYIAEMVRLHEEVGVSYFKWDGIGQYGCDSPLHHHGNDANDPEERADCYAYEMGRSMIRVAGEITRRCPGSIVDFDITEGGRFVGLGFLAAGKYFLVNNGPYFHEFDLPPSVKVDPDTINVFFYPGPARPRVCRTGARFDPVVPSVLYLTHYLPDGPRLSQENSLASLVLGGNGLWGDLPALAEDDVAFWADSLAEYKCVAASAANAYPRVRGFAGSSPEVHEKIDPAAAEGLVAFFTVTPGRFEHLTAPLDLTRLCEVKGADAWEARPGGRLLLRVDLPRNGARVVYLRGKQVCCS